jgi:hypothetical protein
MSRAVVDQVDPGLEMDLRLAVGAHAADHAPQAVVAECHRRNQRMERRLARLESIRVGRVEREIRAAVLQNDAAVASDHGDPKTP